MQTVVTRLFHSRTSSHTKPAPGDLGRKRVVFTHGHAA
jgi:hypothetical protein